MVVSRKEKMSLLPMGECNDPNYGLSEEATLGPGSLLQHTWLTEQVRKEMGFWVACGRWEPGLHSPAADICFPHSETVEALQLLVGDYKHGAGLQ